MNLRSIIGTSELKRKRYLRLTRLVRLRPTDRVLELGCGSGHRSIAYWNHENEIVGLDLAKPSRVVAQPNFTYLQCDATDLSAFPDQSFDVALSVGMLEHIVPDERLARAISEARRVARRYAFVVPHRYAFIEPHYQMPLFPIWPDALRHAYERRHPRRSPVIWPTAAEWRALFGYDPTLRILNHWYGPLLLYRIMVGGQAAVSTPVSSAAETAGERGPARGSGGE